MSRGGHSGVKEDAGGFGGHPQALCWQSPWLAAASRRFCTNSFVVSWNFSEVLELWASVKNTRCCTTMLPDLRGVDTGGHAGSGDIPTPPSGGGQRALT